MTPQQWARVLQAGQRAAKGTPPLVDAASALERVLSAMVTETLIIARETE